MRFQKSILAPTSLLLLSSTPLGAQTWSSGSDLQPPRTSMGATSVGGKAFLAGGNSVTETFDAVNVYDAATDAWSTAALSAPRSSLAATSVGDLALFAGGKLGSVASDVVDIYDTAMDTWLSPVALTQARQQLAATRVGNYALFAGGHPAQGQDSDRVDIFDASSGLWSQVSLSVARGRLAATTVGPYALFAGGEKYNTVYYDVVDIYDSTAGPPTDPAAWFQASLSVGRSTLAATSTGTRAYFAGGIAWDPSEPLPLFFDTVDVYDSCVGPPWDPAAWSVAHLSEPRAALAATSEGERALFAGGGRVEFPPTGIEYVRFTNVDVFDSTTGTRSLEHLAAPREALAATTVAGRALFAGGYEGTAFVPHAGVDTRLGTERHWYVAATAAGPGDGTLEDPFLDIQDAVRAASPGDFVHVGPGVYRGTSTILIDRDLTVVGTCGSEATRIGGQDLPGADPTVSVASDVTAELSGVSLHGGYRGLLIDPGATVTVERCSVLDNAIPIHGTASVAGVGIYVAAQASLKLTSTLVANNTVYRTGGMPTYQFVTGAGLFCEADSELEVRACEFIGNGALFGPGPHSTVRAGGVAAWGAARIENTLFTGNLADSDPAVVGLLLDVVNCTFVDNRTEADPTPDFHQQIAWVGSVKNSILWDTVGTAGAFAFDPIEYSMIGGGNAPGPRFVDPVGPDGIDGSGDEDYRLRRRSPAIDAGDNGAVSPDVTTDLAGRPRFRDHVPTADTGLGGPPVVDMGAYEFQPLHARNRQPIERP